MNHGYIQNEISHKKEEKNMQLKFMRMFPGKPYQMMIDVLRPLLGTWQAK